jgi:hypothetical protein
MKKKEEKKDVITHRYITTPRLLLPADDPTN